jgi:hypothetical protein
MKRSIVLIPALGAMLALSANAARSSGVADTALANAQVPNTAAAHVSAGLLTRAERAIKGYVAACISGEGQALRRVATYDLRVEYTLNEPGMYLSIEGGASPVNCAAIGGGAQVSNLWIFPTSEASSVFMQYEVPGSTGTTPQTQLALVEMHGERVARIVNFGALPAALVAALPTQKTEQIASLK